MTATRADLGCLPQSRRRWQKAAGLVVGEVAGESAGLEIRVEPALADVNAGGDGGLAAGGRGSASGRAARYRVRVRVLRVLGLSRSETPAPAADSQDHYDGPRPATLPLSAQRPAHPEILAFPRSYREVPTATAQGGQGV